MQPDPATAIAEEILGLSSPDAPDDALARARAKLKDEYWALKPFHDEEFAADIIEKFEDHLQVARFSGLGEVVWQAYCTYLLLDQDATHRTFGTAPSVSPQFGGEAGEFVLTDVSHYRNLVKHKKTLITGERPAFEPQAATADKQAMTQVDVARHVIDYVVDQRALGRGLHDAAEMALVMGASYIHLAWDPYAGNPTGRKNPVTGREVYTGDVVWHALTPFEVAHQPVRQYESAKWHVVRTFESRYDLAAKLLDQSNADAAEKVLAAEYGESDYQFVMPTSDIGLGGETIPVYTLYHDRTPAVPGGRMTRVTGDCVILEDRELPFPEALIYRMCPNQFLGTAVPFADSWSWLALHESANAIMSPMLSRVDAFGNPVLSIPEGSDWKPDDFGGYRLHERPAGSENPSLVDFANIPGSLPQIYGLVTSELDRISGINSVVRGAPAENISSGSMAALVHAQAVQFSSDDEETFIALGEAAVMGSLQLYQSMASEEMMISVAGKEGAPSLQTFSGDSIRNIKRVTVKRTSAFMRTTAGKQESANALMANGLIKSPQEYLATVETGTYSSLFTDATQQMGAIHDENATLLKGEPVEADELENHKLHYTEHVALLDAATKANPAVRQVIKAHIAEHAQMWAELSARAPQMLQAAGVPPLPPPPQVQMEMQQRGMAPPQQGGEPPRKPGPAPAPRGMDNKAKGGKQPGMPGMPKQPDGSPVAS